MVNKTQRKPKNPGETATTGRRYKQFPDGDVFVVRKHPETGSLEPVILDPADQKLAQFHNVVDAQTWIRQVEVRSRFVGHTIAIIEVRRIFEFQTVETPRIKVIQKDRILAEPKIRRGFVADFGNQDGGMANLPGEEKV